MGYLWLRRLNATGALPERSMALVAATRVEALMQAAAFDNTTTLSAIINTLTQNNESRKAALDKAIHAFDATMSDVLTSIKDASSSLTTASDGMRSVVDSTARSGQPNHADFYHAAPSTLSKTVYLSQPLTRGSFMSASITAFVGETAASTVLIIDRTVTLPRSTRSA